jgi:membrane protein YdbS with pleckstrin-like domain
MYYISAVLAIACAVLPYVWSRLVSYRWSTVLGDLLAAALWIIAFGASVYFGDSKGWKRWWLLSTAPVALFPAVRTLVVFIIWRFRGFAP